jgi:hypothetical protein
MSRRGATLAGGYRWGEWYVEVRLCGRGSQMRTLKRVGLVVPLVALVAILVGLPATALGKDDGSDFTARLIGFNEVPSINTEGTALLRLKLNSATNTLDFTLTFQNLSSRPLVAHAHFGQARTNGSPMVFFCGGGGQPACPMTTSDTITGKITAANVVGPAGQGIQAGDIVSVMRAIRVGASYANMHTSNFTGGEIRGQIERRTED